MEVVDVAIDDATLFDKLVADPSLRDYGDLHIVTKDGGTKTGRACAVLAFTVNVDGKQAVAQTVVPIRLLLLALTILSANYTEDGFRQKLPKGVH